MEQCKLKEWRCRLNRWSYQILMYKRHWLLMKPCFSSWSLHMSISIITREGKKKAVVNLAFPKDISKIYLGNKIHYWRSIHIFKGPQTLSKLLWLKKKTLKNPPLRYIQAKLSFCSISFFHFFSVWFYVYEWTQKSKVFSSVFC